MKHLFIINPTAGKRDMTEYVKAEAARVFSGRDDEYEIYVTKAPRDAEDVIRARAAEVGELRVYACGGDGTLNECANGAAFLENVAVTHFPCGTGNDFIKTFGDDSALFRDLEQLVNGTVRPIDLIACNERYGLNVCSVGADANIGANVHKYSKFPLIKGGGGYIIATIVQFFKGFTHNINISCAGERFNDGITLACVCNGQYYGGSFNPSPRALPDDGILELLVVRAVSRPVFIRLVLNYAKGRADKMPKYVTILRGDCLHAGSDEDFVVNIDGEIISVRQVEFSLKPGALRFIFPQNTTSFIEIQEKTGAFLR